VQIKRNGSMWKRFYFLKDHLGSIRVTVNASGNVVSYDDYYPFGALMYGRSQESSSVDGRYKFTGKERDAETEYDYFGARYYDARIGRWLQVDPMAEKYPGWSPYAYVMNNPLLLKDADGRFIIIDDFLVGFARGLFSGGGLSGAWSEGKRSAGLSVQI